MNPVLRKGFPALFKDVTGLLAEQRGLTFPDHPEYWPAMWKIQGAHLNLSSVLERFSLFAFGRGTGPTQAMKNLDHREAEMIKRDLDVPVVEVYSMRDRSNVRMSSAQKPFQTWYQVRSNLVHQGKSTRDFEKVYQSVSGLNEALALVLACNIPLLVDRWREDLDGCHPILDFLSRSARCPEDSCR